MNPKNQVNITINNKLKFDVVKMHKIKTNKWNKVVHCSTREHANKKAYRQDMFSSPSQHLSVQQSEKRNL